MLKVNEIFFSIQGESTWMGAPCVFIRLTGCNLRCRWCDTAYAYSDGREMSVDDIMDAVKRYPCKLAEITGGEPLTQDETPALASRLLKDGYTVLCETNGSLPIDRLPSGVCRIMDIKCPGSGESDRNLWSNIDSLTTLDEVKFVIAGRDDFDWARAIVDTYNLSSRTRAVHFSAAGGSLAPRELICWLLESGVPARYQPQLHKLLAGPDGESIDSMLERHP